jgi:hypothetical protein
MKKVIFNAVLAAALLGSGGAFGQDKTKGGGAEGRGGLAEWPVSKEEADWSSARPSGSASSAGTTDKTDKK